ncbi:DUF1653 domain-containing protein [Legionella sp. km772]|uniref:DUF1653 domain-containing protein n=1 Tax=Legionella sp. km772 TaxID=2498111 RepID=UPI000F8D7AEA|nr:DUF1653 domain-containing protein [Legionella sp. km772]RUR09657.1 DUF1653 domain-containing protein [Legionella sp. km772]
MVNEIDLELRKNKEAVTDPLLGKYKHYKNGQLYEVIGKAHHSETCEEMIVYRTLYHSEQFGDNQLWVRPLKMFFEKVIHQGLTVCRFERLE